MTVLLCALTVPLSACASDQLHAIPFSLSEQESGGETTVGSDSLTIKAMKGTDLFTDAKGTIHAQSVPKITFIPSGDFELSARIEAKLDDPYDGAGFVIHDNEASWAKVIFERFKSGQLGVASTVVSIKGDDAYHGFEHNNFVYLKLTRKAEVYIIQTSIDGENWSYKRSFSLGSTNKAQIGFMAQSPLGEDVIANFSNISFVSQ